MFTKTSGTPFSDTLPEVLRLTAESNDGVVMAIEHEPLPIAAVQFHPESILKLAGGMGIRMINNVIERLAPGANT